MTAKLKPAPAEVPAQPLPTRGGCYTIENGALTPAAISEADEPSPAPPVNQSAEGEPK
jgi:hypothetical protein